MFVDQFSPASALIGGGLIGLSASIMLLFNGRIAGISGIFSGLLRPKMGDFAWRALFVLGLVFGGLVAATLMPGQVLPPVDRSLLATAAAGLFVGFGVRLGSGCTSGHGVCGLSRFSRRSLVATCTFMATGFITATCIQLFAGGQL